MHRSKPQTMNSTGWATLRKQYKIDESIIGKGAYGEVYSAVDKLTGKKIAIKTQTFFNDSDDVIEILRETKLLRMLQNHPNIISLKQITVSKITDSKTELNFVFDRWDCDLYRVIISPQPLTPLHVKFFIYQALLAVDYMHSVNVIHRDLKTGNLLVNSNCDLVVCDFGQARSIAASHKHNCAPGLIYRNKPTEYVTTRWYRAIELALESRSGTPLDMWSLGCILAELLSREPLFPAKSSLELVNLILNFIGPSARNDCDWIDNEINIDIVKNFQWQPNKHYKPKFYDADPLALDLLIKLLTFNPNKRISAKKALQHPYFIDIYKKEHVLTYPIKPRSDADRQSLVGYYQFELELDYLIERSVLTAVATISRPREFSAKAGIQAHSGIHVPRGWCRRDSLVETTVEAVRSTLKLLTSLSEKHTQATSLIINEETQYLPRRASTTPATVNATPPSIEENAPEEAASSHPSSPVGKSPSFFGLDRRCDQRIHATPTARPMDPATSLDPGFRRELSGARNSRNSGQAPFFRHRPPFRTTNPRGTDRGAHGSRLSPEITGARNSRNGDQGPFFTVRSNDLSSQPAHTEERNNTSEIK